MAILEPGSDREEKNDGEWGTREEYVLAAAVNRHGANWDSVAGEVQRQSSRSDFHYTSYICHSKYLDLVRQFAVHDSGEEVVHRGIEEELRKRRMEALRRELKRGDVTIEYIETKLKKLKEEEEETKQDEDADLRRQLNNPAAEEEEVGEVAYSGDGKKTEHLLESENENRAFTGPELPVAEPVETTPEPGCPLELPELDGGSEDPVAESNLEPEQPDVRSCQQTSERRRNNAEDDGQIEPFITTLGLIRSHRSSHFFENRLPIQSDISRRTRKRNREDISEDDKEDEDYKIRFSRKSTDKRVRKRKGVSKDKEVDKQPRIKVIKEDKRKSKVDNIIPYKKDDVTRGKAERKKVTKGDTMVGRMKQDKCSKAEDRIRKRKGSLKDNEEDEERISSGRKNISSIDDIDEEEMVDIAKGSGRLPKSNMIWVVIDSSSEEDEDDAPEVKMRESRRKSLKRDGNEVAGKVVKGREHREDRRGGEDSSKKTSGIKRRRGRPRKSSPPPLPIARDCLRAMLNLLQKQM